MVYLLQNPSVLFTIIYAGRYALTKIGVYYITACVTSPSSRSYVQTAGILITAEKSAGSKSALQHLQVPVTVAPCSDQKGTTLVSLISIILSTSIP